MKTLSHRKQCLTSFLWNTPLFVYLVLVFGAAVISLRVSDTRIQHIRSGATLCAWYLSVCVLKDTLSPRGAVDVSASDTGQQKRKGSLAVF